MPGYLDPVLATHSLVANGFGFFRQVQPAVALGLAYPAPGPSAIDLAALLPPSARAAWVRLTVSVVGGAWGSAALYATVNGDYQESAIAHGPGNLHRQALLYLRPSGIVTFSWAISGMGGAIISLAATLTGYFEG